MEDDQFDVSVGDHKKVIYARILNETAKITAAVSMANTHTNRRWVAERDVSDLKANCNCTKHIYKCKNHKYKTVHECLIYNFANTQDRLAFMDDLVKFLINRRFPDGKKDFRIFELVRGKAKDGRALSERKLRLNPQVSITPRPLASLRKRKKYLETNKLHAEHERNSRSPGNSSSKVKKRKGKIVRKNVAPTPSRPITRSVTRETRPRLTSTD